MKNNEKKTIHFCPEPSTSYFSDLFRKIAISIINRFFLLLRPGLYQSNRINFGANRPMHSWHHGQILSPQIHHPTSVELPIHRHFLSSRCLLQNSLLQASTQTERPNHQTRHSNPNRNHLSSMQSAHTNRPSLPPLPALQHKNCAQHAEPHLFKLPQQ